MIVTSIVIATLLCPAPAQEEDPWLPAALETATWLQGMGLDAENGRTWPTQVEGDPQSNPSLYSGAPGVVLFFLEAYAQTRLTEFREEARAGADDLLARWEGEATDPGLYTGLAGVGFTLGEVWKATGEEKYRAGAVDIVAKLQATAKEAGGGVHWNGVTDIISGNAGIGLFLLYAQAELELPSAGHLAARAGDYLVEAGIEADPGTKWAMNDEFPRRMPNFSHGTAGIGYFLVRLWQTSAEERYLDAARRGAEYLTAITVPREGGGGLIFHSEPGNEELFYLSWCHGPVGTVRFFDALEQAAPGEGWDAGGAALTAGLLSSGVPERSPGFWNNAGLCCGDAGVADFLLGKGTSPELADAVLAALLERSTLDTQGRRWTHAEHRVRPELLTTQTGLQQGAAGIGLILLRASAIASGRPVTVRLPDEPR